MNFRGDFAALRLRILSYLVGSFEFLDNAQVITRKRLGLDEKKTSEKTVIPLNGKVRINGRGPGSANLIARVCWKTAGLLTYCLCFSSALSLEQTRGLVPRQPLSLYQGELT